MKKRKKKLLQTLQAKRRRELHARRARVLRVYKARLHGKPVKKSDFLFVSEYGTVTERLKRQIKRNTVTSKSPRVYISISFTQKVKAKPHKATRTKRKLPHEYRQDTDRGNWKIRTYSKYVKLTLADMDNGNLGHRITGIVQRYEKRFNRAKQYDRFSASVQIFRGKIVNPYSGLLGKPSSISMHANMGSVRRMKESGELSGFDFAYEIVELERNIGYMEEVGFLNYSAEEEEE